MSNDNRNIEARSWRPTRSFWYGMGWCVIFLGFGGCVMMSNSGGNDEASPNLWEYRIKQAEAEAEIEMSPAQLAAKYHGLTNTAGTKDKR